MLYTGLPLLDQDADFPPAEVQRVRTEVFLADGLWFFTPEYHSSYPGVLKNLLDWLAIPRWKVGFPPGTVIQGKKTAISGAGGKSAASGARQKLTELLKTIQAIPMEEPQTGVALTPKFIARGRLVLSPQEQMALRNQAEAFLRFWRKSAARRRTNRMPPCPLWTRGLLRRQFLRITHRSNSASRPGRISRISRMADRQPIDRVWTMASIVGFLNSGPTSAVISTMMEPEVSTV